MLQMTDMKTVDSDRKKMSSDNVDFFCSNVVDITDITYMLELQYQSDDSDE